MKTSSKTLLDIPTLREIDDLAEIFCQEEIIKPRLSSKAKSCEPLSYNPNGICGGSKSEWEHLLEAYSMTGRASF